MNAPRPARTLLGVALLALAAALAPAAPARAADDDVVPKMTSGRLERIMNSFTDVKNFKETDNNQYSFETSGLKIVLFNGGESLELLAVFVDKPTLTRLNEWNQTKKYTKAYLNKNNNAVLHHSIELNGGVTEKNVKEWMGTFVINLKAFKKHLAE